ncbi:DNA invertase Pin-like site-specific DNA recombinase [Staphylococcus hominis]
MYQHKIKVWMDKIFFTMMSAFAELEANLLSERTKKELDVARARGRKRDDLHYLTIRREKLNSYMMNKN